MGNLDLLKWNQYDRLWGLSDEVFSMSWECLGMQPKMGGKLLLSYIWARKLMCTCTVKNFVVSLYHQAVSFVSMYLAVIFLP